ncbi:aldehyde dehydrogenase family protein [Nonomuraea sp. NPDC050451]|uniref:aldehyde dehydrogenase family protein n=1 Tax=Nonomuraea sp. NPDC050451 TaxID=3364364 RepID=UPI003795294F
MAADILRFHAGEPHRAQGETYASPRAGERILVQRRPVGVVGVITPWNFPIAIPAWKIAPALVHGNTVVWKPASLVPLLAVRLTEALSEAGLPPGVLSTVFVNGKDADLIVGHHDIDAITFTGSTQVGRGLLERCGGLIKPVQAEMGGKNAAVVLADVDLDLAARLVADGAMASTGQKCTATSRVVVAREVRDAFLERLCARVASLRVGDGLQPGVDVGPVASASARQEVLGHIDLAVREGASILVGGDAVESKDDGYFVRPTVALLADRDVALWREEVFGPVLAVTTAACTEEALELANDSEFGLSGAVFTNDLTAALKAMARFEVGVLHVNSESTGADPHVPFGGVKQSGCGPKEQGRAARDFYTQTSTVYLRGSAE